MGKSNDGDSGGDGGFGKKGLNSNPDRISATLLQFLVITIDQILTSKYKRREKSLKLTIFIGKKIIY